MLGVLDSFCDSAMPAHRTRCSSARLLIFLFLFISFDSTMAVCPHCKDSISGCKGGGDCPLFTELAHNVEVIASSTVGKHLKLSNLINPFFNQLFPRDVQETIIMINSAPVGGTHLDLSSGAYTTSKSVVEAACWGHCTTEEAILELNSRMEDAEDALAVSKITGAIELLKSRTDVQPHMDCGVFSFIYSKLAASFEVPQSIRIGAQNKKSALVTAVKRATSVDQFYQLCLYFCLIVGSMGLISYSTVMEFIDQVAFQTINKLKESWNVAQVSGIGSHLSP